VTTSAIFDSGARRRWALGVAVADARNHWKMLRRRREHPRRIERARRRIAALVDQLQQMD